MVIAPNRDIDILNYQYVRFYLVLQHPKITGFLLHSTRENRQHFY